MGPASWQHAEGRPWWCVVSVIRLSTRVSLRDRRDRIERTGKPDAVKVARPVCRGVDGKGSSK